MKNIKIILLTLLGLFLFQSCSEDILDDINTNPNEPTDVPSRLIITDVMVASAFSLTAADNSFYAGVYSELNAGNHNQTYKAQTRDGEPQKSTTYNNAWNTSYRQLRSLKIILEKCSTGGSEQGNYQTLGVAQILYAYNLALLTDLFGDVPHSEALNIQNLQPKLDKQEMIYQEVFKMLNEGIVNLGKTSSYASLGSQDVVYGGNSSKWIKAANGLLARYTMRLSLVKPNYQAVIDYVDNSFTNATDEFKLVNGGITNPYARFEMDRGGLCVAKSFYDLMVANGSADARTAVFFTKKNGAVNPLDNSLLNPMEAQNVYSISGIMNAKNPIYVQGYHELLFLKAEAQARLGQEAAAKATLNLAIKAAYTKQQVVAFTSAQADAYIASIGTLAGRKLLKKIMIEKHISFYENEGIEDYNDTRRLAAMGDGDLVPLVNARPELFPQRFGYGNSDVSANVHVREAFGDGSYVYKEKVWWAGGTR
ncbi:SusD/RagB family nutrient-binding outer membrane lipoprotein [Flavobacterium succinicans]|uniref:Susd and RagB outer membrane lipoprotein n=1 Tax=Flavobacterium succinicans TaxID=29536 RepID=A0A199XNG9_9FLAO|nr:SusD/RagB family nutrient-binding outer membrane lipoprotein [Flavobacterium succinicans]OAZ03180.1 susd and RagB outer membrane lipoprotein [Flavobacterium succinicans]